MTPTGGDDTGRAVDHARVVELARAAVGRLAPEELPIFDAVGARVAADPERGLDPDRTRDDMLGFGVDAAVSLLTPAAIAVAAEVIRHVAVHLPGRLRRPSLGRWTPEELGRIHEVAYRKATAARLNDARATALADAMVASLAMAAD